MCIVEMKYLKLMEKIGYFSIHIDLILITYTRTHSIPITTSRANSSFWIFPYAVYAFRKLYHSEHTAPQQQSDEKSDVKFQKKRERRNNSVRLSYSYQSFTCMAA